VTGLARAYRVLAYVVGVLLAFCTLTSLLKYLAPDGSGPQQLGADLAFLWALHGFIYIAYFVLVFLLFVRERWTVQFTALVLVAGLVPLLMFWVERQVVHKLRGEESSLERVADSAT
jgi:integral membrane protein